MNEYIRELTSVRDFIRYAATIMTKENCYFGHGTDNAWDEATALVFHCLELPHENYHDILDAKLLADEKKLILLMLGHRVQEKKPLPYITKQANFAGLSFYVDDRVIIPRSPMAELIQAQFEPWIAADKVEHILDLCCGSGCIAISCAVFFPHAVVDAIDNAPDALQVAKTNLELHHHLESRINLIHSDLFASLNKQKYDVIIANPPYVDLQDMQQLPAEYQHEPRAALAGGDDGLIFVKQILQQAGQYLTAHGVLFMEVGNSAIELQKQFPHYNFTWLDFEHGEGEVLVISKAELDNLA